MVTEGSKLRLYRIQKGLTLEEAADKLGISRQTLQKYEQDSLSIPISVFIRMVNLYEVDSFSLFGVEDYKEQNLIFDISVYYLVKAFVLRQIKAEIKKEQMFSLTEINTKYFSMKFKSLLKKHLTILIMHKPELKDELKNEFNNDTDFEIN